MSNDIKILENGQTANIGSNDYLNQVISRPGEIRIVDHFDHIPGCEGHEVTTIKSDGSFTSELG
ncbi:MAG: hypothetical protein ABIJ59_12280 [Pseudomonadota bacterium]